MIRLTRINGSEFSLNPDLIHRAEETPDTVLTLIDGSRYVVVQKLDELIDRIVEYRARVVAAAGAFTPSAAAEDLSSAGVDADDEHLVEVDPQAAPGTAGGVADVVRLRARRA
ncbi:flagellar FlbD family protein [Aquipuribacter sp. MA13-6]|uniref:flagellar FlbD family protein n=1 Tax=unclassified Aquipuribacter TaxID=2635084 RepID=UPI003EEA61F6